MASKLASAVFNPLLSEDNVTVKVTLEFKNVDEAIVALGKLALPVRQISATPDVGAPSAPPVAAATPVAAEFAKRGRGRPRKDNAAPTPTVAPSTEPATAADNSVTGVASGAAPSVPEVPSQVPSAEDVQSVVQKLFDTKGFNVCAEVLARFGVKRAKDLQPEQRAEFVKYANTILGG